MTISKPVKIGIGIVGAAVIGFGIYKLVQYLNKPESTSNHMVHLNTGITPIPVTPNTAKKG